MSDKNMADDYDEKSDRLIFYRTFVFLLPAFVVYLSIGMLMATLPLFIAHDLGLDAIWVGLIFSAQYIAILFAGPMAGRLTDSLGPKRTTLFGITSCLVSALLMMCAGVAASIPSMSVMILLGARVCLGVAESMSTSGSVNWAIRSLGKNNLVKVVSAAGIINYGAMALGAPLGVLIVNHFGFKFVGVVAAALSILHLPLTLKREKMPGTNALKMSFFSVFRRVFPYGVCLGLGTVGFSVLSTFVALYFEDRHWLGSYMPVTMFGAAFIMVRILLSNAVKKYGSMRVVVGSLAVEATGLLLLWQSASQLEAILAASVIGAGFALVFPALAAEALSRVSDANRGAALSSYVLCLDVAMGISAPLGGFIAEHFGAVTVFLFGGLAALTAFILALRLLVAKSPARDELAQ
jgi:MFS family permease